MPRVVDVDQRRAELTDAAARVIARSGIEAATMRQIAAEAGWTTGTLTHYFTDKADLLLATFQSSLAHRRSLRAEHRQASAFDRLRASLEGALPLDQERREHWLVTLTCCTQASTDARLARAQRDAYREFRHYLTALVGQHQDEAGLTSAAEARTVAERLIATADGVAMQALFDPASWPPERQLAALEAALEALTPGGRRPRPGWSRS